MILCDIGNTTFHFQTSSKTFKVSVEQSLKTYKELLLSQPLYFLSVNQTATNKLLEICPNGLDISPYVKLSTPYQGIGIDRKIVCTSIGNGIIVDFGSAITIDIMKNHHHQGGYIFPGLRAYEKIYPKISEKLHFKFKNDLNLDKIPLSTDDAINHSIILSIILPIKKIYKHHNVPLYFTGEDSKLIFAYFKKIPFKYKKNLIFKSMKKIIKENLC